MENIEIFTGNRAEFGILLPLIEKISEKFYVNLIVSGAHLVKKWGTIKEIENTLKHIENINIVKLKIKYEDTNQYSFIQSYSRIYKAYINYKKKNNKKLAYCLFLGDRIETVAYATVAFYFGNILVHIAGGDIADVPTFDASIKHSLTKISHLHLVTNEQSANVVKQLGEEEWRVKNIGMPSLDLITDAKIISKESLKKKFKLKSDNIIVLTFHPDYFDKEKILENFREIIKGIQNTKYQTILTYPNNDPGYEILLDEIETELQDKENLLIIKNLGSRNYLSLLNELNVIMIGNSSGILTESSFFKTPGLLLGNRQNNRLRGGNVTELKTFTHADITNYINSTFLNYKLLKKSYYKTQFIYGDGNSGKKVSMFLYDIFKNKTKTEILSKKFILIKKS